MFPELLQNKYQRIMISNEIRSYPFSVKYALVRSFSEVKLRKRNN